MTDKNKNNLLIERPPVIVVMGHIDHGKSTLLDFIRKTNIVEKEAGSITQHVAAYEVVHKEKDKKKITFIDTPGHEAFSAARSIGACLADIAILIISAEDSVKPQTLEAYKDIQKAKIPFIVAINKIDKADANVKKVKQDLMEKGIFLEGLGGDTPFVAISAKTGEGIPELLDTILLIAEMEELKGDKNKLAEGFVLESKINPKKGIETVVIIKDGILQKGNFIVVGGEVNCVRNLEDVNGHSMGEVMFSSPIKLTGFRVIPKTGAVFKTYLTKKEATDALGAVQTTTPISAQKKADGGTMSDEDEKISVPIIIKTDVFGTIDALRREMEKIKHERATLKIISASVGNITENDIKLASKGDVLIVGFNVKVSQHVKELAERRKVKIAVFDIIYKLTEWLEKSIGDFIPKIKVEEKIGVAKIIKVFSKTKNSQIVGGRVESGKLAVSSDVKILRRDYEIGRGYIENIQKQKTKAKEINEGDEFGMDIKSKADIASGDILEAYEVVEK